MIAPFISVRIDERGALYTYKNHIEGLVRGDVVVVCMPSGKFTCGRVESIKPSKSERDKATKYIVDRVDQDKWRALTALDPPPEPKELTYADISARAIRHLLASWSDNDDKPKRRKGK